MKSISILGFLLILLAAVSMFSCNTGQYELPIAIENVDDELGVAYGTIVEKTSHSETIAYSVAVPYNCIKYVKENNTYLLNVDKFNERDTTDQRYYKLLQSYQLKGPISEERAGEVAKLLLQ